MENITKVIKQSKPASRKLYDKIGRPEGTVVNEELPTENRSLKFLIKLALVIVISYGIWNYATWEVPIVLNFDLKDKIALVEEEMKKLCDLWPHNINCFMLKRAVNPIPIHNEDGMTLTTKMIVKKLLTGDEEITFVGTGTSHTAGHDTLFGYNYLLKLEKLTEDAFASVNISFNVKARGVGSVGSHPRQIYCHDGIYGDEPDIVMTDGFFGYSDCDKERFFQYNLRQEKQPVYYQVQVCGPCGLNNAWATGKTSIHFE